MNKILQILIGLIFLIAGIFAWGMNYFSFGTAAINFIKGGFMWIVLLIGLTLIILGISGLKE